MKIILLLIMTFLSVNIMASDIFTGGTSKDESDGKPSIHTFEDGIFTWTLDGEIMVAGDYILKGGYLIVEDISGPRACVEEEDTGLSVGMYRVQKWEDKYYFAVVHDKCGGRQRGFLSMKGLE